MRAFTVPSRYKLRLSVCAIRQDTRSLVILPEEATLTRHGTPNVDGMVAVTCLGSLYSVFSVDLEERAILIEDAVAEKRAAAGA